MCPVFIWLCFLGLYFYLKHKILNSRELDDSEDEGVNTKLDQANLRKRMETLLVLKHALLMVLAALATLWLFDILNLIYMSA